MCYDDHSYCEVCKLHDRTCWCNQVVPEELLAEEMADGVVHAGQCLGHPELEPDEDFGVQPWPGKPCQYCVGDSAVVLRWEDNFTRPVRMTSAEWCEQANACAATIDWEKVAGR